MPAVQEHAENICTVGGSAAHTSVVASAGRMAARLSSCTQNIGSSTVAATFHDGGGGRGCSAVPLPSAGNQPPKLPSSRCSVIFSASTSSDAPSLASPAPRSSQAWRSVDDRQRWRSSLRVNTMATVLGALTSPDGIWIHW